VASISFPRPGYNGGRLSNWEHELVAGQSSPYGLGGYPTDPPPVVADSTSVRGVRVRAGLWVQMRGSVWQSGPTDIPLTVEPNTSGFARIDLVVVRLDRSTYELREHVITGSPAPTPQAPQALRQWGPSGFYDFPLAEVRVPHNAGALPVNSVTIRGWYVGEDGNIRCTSDSRPPHLVGRIIWQHDTSSVWVSDGNVWRPVNDRAEFKERVTITPRANQPTRKWVKFPDGMFTAAPAVQVSVDSEVPGEQVRGVSFSDPSPSGVWVWVNRTNTVTTTVQVTASQN